MCDRRTELEATPDPAAEGGRSGRRLWRLRKLHQSVDAELWPGNPDGVELRYVLNGAPAYRRTWASRDEAVRQAMTRRAELERDGWLFHW